MPLRTGLTQVDEWWIGSQPEETGSQTQNPLFSNAVTFFFGFVGEDDDRSKPFLETLDSRKLHMSTRISTRIW